MALAGPEPSLSRSTGRAAKLFARLRSSLALSRPSAAVAVGIRPCRRWRDIRYLVKLRWRALLFGLNRRHFRSNEIALTVFGGVVGGAIGAGVVVVRQVSQWVHQATWPTPRGASRNTPLSSN